MKSALFMPCFQRIALEPLLTLLKIRRRNKQLQLKIFIYAGTTLQLQKKEYGPTYRYH